MPSLDKIIFYNNMNVPLKPINKSIIIRELKQKETTKSGLVLPPHDVEEIVEAGKVVAVAEDCKNDINVGDVVYYCKYNPQDLKLEVDGKDIVLFVAHENDIMAIVEK